MKIRSTAYIAATFLALLILTTPVHAQTVPIRWDKASYQPGDAGTLFVTIINDSTTDPLEIRNVTVYFPWAGIVDGKWNGANDSRVQTRIIGSANSGANNHTEQFTFSIPSWFGELSSDQNPVCGSGTTRLAINFHGCVIVGTTGNAYDRNQITISMAQASYTPPSLLNWVLPLANLVVLVVATALLFLMWTSLRQPAKK